jgi:hypothetical protein
MVEIVYVGAAETTRVGDNPAELERHLGHEAERAAVPAQAREVEVVPLNLKPEDVTKLVTLGIQVLLRVIRYRLDYLPAHPVLSRRRPGARP